MPTKQRAFFRIICFNKARAFTLVEMVIVTVIVASLAAVGLPHYFKAKERALQRQALVNVRLIAVGQRANFTDGKVYKACECSDEVNCNSAGGCNTIFRLNLSPKEWQYSASLVGASFQVQAFRGLTGCTYTLIGAAIDPTPNGSCK